MKKPKELTNQDKKVLSEQNKDQELNSDKFHNKIGSLLKLTFVKKKQKKKK